MVNFDAVTKENKITQSKLSTKSWFRIFIIEGT